MSTFGSIRSLFPSEPGSWRSPSCAVPWSADKKAGMTLCYESAKGYKTVGDGWWTIPEDQQWQEHSWKISDANFVGQWGWNFRFDAVSSPNEFLVKEGRVSKVPLPDGK